MPRLEEVLQNLSEVCRRNGWHFEITGPHACMYRIFVKEFNGTLVDQIVSEYRVSPETIMYMIDVLVEIEKQHSAVRQLCKGLEIDLGGL